MVKKIAEEEKANEKLEAEFYAEWPDVEPSFNEATGEWENTEESPERQEAREAFETKMEPKYT